MKWMQEQSKYENTVYVALWSLLFAAPLLSLYVRTANDSELTFDWQEIWLIWRQFGVYLLLFLIHNFLLAPLLVHQQRRVLYFSIAGALIAAFMAYQCSQRPDRMEHRPHRMEMRQGPPPRDFRHHKPDRPPVFIGQRDIVAIVVVILMFGANLGIKLYFKTRDDRKRLLALEKENLEQQLEYLRYQINPHFFMNTLNNIHALVDIDPEKAKETILELSKMMRFVLYEGDKKGVPLSREFDFIRHYITLMKLRYTDKVSITVDLPNEVPDRQIPPLMLITFIENAFKHGISYQHASFIDINIEVAKPASPTPHLLFTCRNSKADKPHEEKGGVGLQNVKQRLNLLYGNNYTLNIQDAPDVYQVELTIPL